MQRVIRGEHPLSLRRPPKWTVCVVAYSVRPTDRDEYVTEFLREFHNRYKKSARAAHKYARLRALETFVVSWRSWLWLLLMWWRLP